MRLVAGLFLRLSFEAPRCFHVLLDDVTIEVGALYHFGNGLVYALYTELISLLCSMGFEHVPQIVLCEPLFSDALRTRRLE